MRCFEQEKIKSILWLSRTPHINLTMYKQSMKCIGFVFEDIDATDEANNTLSCSKFSVENNRKLSKIRSLLAKNL